MFLVVHLSTTDDVDCYNFQAHDACCCKIIFDLICIIKYYTALILLHLDEILANLETLPLITEVKSEPVV